MLAAAPHFMNVRKQSLLTQGGEKKRNEILQLAVLEVSSALCHDNLQHGLSLKTIAALALQMYIS